MNPNELAILATSAIKDKTNITLVRKKGVKMPPKFPRGSLRCENHDGTSAYSYDPLKILAWLAANGLIKYELLKSGDPQ